MRAFSGSRFFLSNFYEAPVVYKGISYSNNEAAFQAQKCANESDRAAFENLTASEARSLGRRVPLRKDWESVKIGVMEEIVQAKFDQNPELAQALLDTGLDYLVEENDWGDRCWGTVNGAGANNLGLILMRVRERIREAELEIEML